MEYQPEIKCATFDPALQAAIPPHIRAKMDADRAAAVAAKTSGEQFFWLAESPTIPGYYLRRTPRKLGKLTMKNKTHSIGVVSDALVRCPSLCPECQKHIDASNLHWVLCGGLCVGDYVQPKVWRLRDKDELLNVQRRTKDLQRLAGAMRYLCETLPHLPQELRAKVENFISPNARGVPMPTENQKPDNT